MNRAIAGITAIGRPIDLRYHSNRYAVVATIAAGGIAAVIGLLAGDPLVDATSGAAVAGLAAFTAWAVGREIDPDDTGTAAIAAPIAFAALLVGRPYFATIFAVLLMARIVARTTGLPLRPLDGALVIGLAAYVATTPYGLFAVGALALATGLDAGLDGARGWRRWLPAAVLSAGTVTAIVAGEWPGYSIPGFGAIVLVLGAAAGTAMLRGGAPTSTCDHTGEPIETGRMRAARMMTILVVLTYAVIGGNAAIAGLAPVLAALAAAGPAAILARRRTADSLPAGATAARRSA